MRKNFTKGIMAFLFVVALALGLSGVSSVPKISAYADGPAEVATLEQFNAAIANGDVDAITLTDDIGGATAFTTTRDLSIDLGQHTLTFAGTNTRLISNEVGHTLTITNGSISYESSVLVGDMNAFISNNGILTLDRVNVTLNNIDSNGTQGIPALCNQGEGVLVVNRSVIVANYSGTTSNYKPVGIMNMGRKLYLTNSTITINCASQGSSYGVYNYIDEGETDTGNRSTYINGSTITLTTTAMNNISGVFSESYLDEENEAIIYIGAGTIVNVTRNVASGSGKNTYALRAKGSALIIIVEDVTLTINDDTQCEQSEIQEETDGVIAENESSIIYGVFSAAELVAVNNAIQASGEAATIVLTNNFTCTSDVVFRNDITFDLNGHNITFTSWGFEVRNGATLTIAGNGTVTAAEACLYAQYAGHLVVNGGTYVSTNNFVIGTNGSSGRGSNVVEVNAGQFTGGIQTSGCVACGIYLANSDTLAVNGGTFNITNGVGVLSRSGSTTIGADAVFNVTGNGTFGRIGDSRVVLPSGEKLVIDFAANYPGGDPTITNNSEYDICAVVESAADIESVKTYADKIVLGTDITSTSDIVFSRDITLDLNGHNVTFAGWGFEINSGKTLTINGTGVVSAAKASLYVAGGATLVVNGGTYTSTTANSIVVLEQSTATINNAVVNAKEVAVVLFDASTATINGGQYNTTDNFVVGTNGSEGRGGNTITINGGTFNGGITSAGFCKCGIYAANDDIITVNGGTFNVQGGIGIAVRAGQVFVDDDVVFNVGEPNGQGKVGDKQTLLPTGKAFVLDFTLADYPGLNENFSFTNDTNYQAIALVNAEAGLQRALECADVDVIILRGNITLSQSIRVQRDLTLNLNGNALTTTSNTQYMIYVTGSGTEFVLTGNGSITTAKRILQVEAGAQATVLNGHYESTHDVAFCACGNKTIKAELVFGDNQTTTETLTATAVEGVFLAIDKGQITINGGEFTCYDNFVVGTNGSNGRGGNIVTINGGTFNGNIQSAGYIANGVYLANNDTLAIDGAIFNVYGGIGVLARAGSFNVSNSTFNMYEKAGLTEGWVGDSKIDLRIPHKFVIDTKSNYPGYNQSKGGTGEVDYNINGFTGNVNDTMPAGVYLIKDNGAVAMIDSNGKSSYIYLGDGSPAAANEINIEVSTDVGDEDLITYVSGILDIVDDAATTAENPVYICNTTNTTLSVAGEGATIDIGVSSIVIDEDNKTSIEFEIHPVDTNGIKIENENLAFTEEVPAITFRIPIPASFGLSIVSVYHEGILMGLYTIECEGPNYYITVSSDSFSKYTVSQLDGYSTDPEAVIGTTGYQTVQDAVDAIVNGTATGTIYIYKDSSVNKVLVTEDVTIDLNGFVLTATGKTAIQVYNNATLTLIGTEPGSTINGTLYVSEAHKDANNNWVWSAGNLLIDGGTYNATIADECTVQTNGVTSGNVITAQNATFNSTDDTFYLAGAGTYSLQDCIINGYTGIYMKAGTLNIQRTTINAEGAYAEPVANGNGASSTGDGIILDSKSGYHGNMELNLGEGVVVNSENGYAIRETYTDMTTTSTHSINIADGEYIGAKGGLVTSEYFEQAVTSGTSSIAISGGEFSSPLKEIYCAEGFTPRYNDGDGKYSVKLKCNTNADGSHIGDTSIGIVLYPATCTHPGKMLHVCLICMEAYVVDIPQLDHNLTHHDAVAPTTTTPGEIEHYHCSGCGHDFVLDGTDYVMIYNIYTGYVGRGIVSIEKDTTNSTDAVSIYIITYNDSTTSTIEVINGTNGDNGAAGTNGATWTAGAVAPDNANGSNGDFYLDTATYNIYQKQAGTWEIIANIKGAQGDQGEEGNAGTNGATWTADAGEPDNANGNDGDLYLDIDSNNIYQKQTGAWVLITNIQGAQGAQGDQGEQGNAGTNGATWTAGAVAPDNANGSNGDFYLDTATYNVYQKQAGTWEIIANIKGAQGDQGEEGNAGTNGATWTADAGEPNNANGNNGDLYLDTDSNNIYQKQAGAWVLITNIQGAQGEQGSQGAQGVAGTNGTTWIVDEGVPAAAIGNVGDLYLNTETNNVYRKTNAGWGEPIATIRGGNGIASIVRVDAESDDAYSVYRITYDDAHTQDFTVYNGTNGTNGTNGHDGAPGANGANWVVGAGVPVAAIGADGDMYLDTNTGNVYQKEDGAWGNPVMSIMGIQGVAGANGTNGTNGTNGVDGSVWYTGSGMASMTLGKDGDMYLNTVTSDVYQKQSGTWEYVTSIKGETGPAGVNGAQGQRGATGVTGRDGVDGKDGFSTISIITTIFAVVSLVLTLILISGISKKKRK